MSAALRRELEKAGGIATLADLARRWGVSRARTGQLAAAEDFPRPVAEVGGWALYVVAEADAWRQARGDKRRAA